MSRSIPRLSAPDMPRELAEMLRPRVERLGYLGEFFQCCAHQPQALMSFMTLTEDLKRALPDNLTEVVALSVACLIDNAYERVQHERLCIKLGFSETWLRKVMSLPGENEGILTKEEQRVQKLVVAVVSRKGHDTSVELQAVIDAVGPARAIAVLMLTGRYMMHSLVVNCLNLTPPVSSPLEKS